MPRDITKAYTEDELVLIKGIFQGIPSYTAENSISSKDIGVLMKRMDYPRTEEQIAVYETYWDKLFEGRIPLEEWISTCRNLHNLRRITIDRAAAFDTDGDGIISLTEFEEIMKIAISHDPKLKGLTYADFVTEADTNKDGKVSIEELAGWMETRVNLA